LSGKGSTVEASSELLDDAAKTYSAYLVEAYGFEPGEIEIPPAYAGRELDWFGHLNEVLTELEDYSGPEARRLLVGRNPWVDGGGSLLGLLREGRVRDLRRILRRL
jgi:hypothetical protein